MKIGSIARALTAERHVHFLRWLLGEAPRSRQAGAEIRSVAVAPLLDRLDLVIGSESLRSALMPRAPDVVPQLMRTLRDENYSSADVAARISKDAVLTAG